MTRGRGDMVTGMLSLACRAGFALWGLPLLAVTEQVDFNRDVRPILSNRCFKCHGPDENTRKGGLRLDERAAALSEGKSGATGVVPGKPEESEVIHRIFAADPDEIMPPVSAKMEMTNEERRILRAWVEQGAPYDPHWAFVPPKKALLPAAAGTSSRNPIDLFVEQRLREAALQPSPRADKYRLVRRVTLDLTGLPPTPEEADAFVHDPSPQAYEKLVDRLLASPRYGERWARRWLDLARYADTNGYEKDRERIIWPWRDWVIRALNADMPFDEFTIKQLAGDMLPHATLDDRIATGFHRNSMLNEEGGIDPLEFRYHAMTDRVATTGATWLGLTVGCAQCHTHKYDPILHTEYFQLMAFLNNADEPSLDLPDPAAQAEQQRRERKASRLIAELPGKWPLPQEADWETPALAKVETASGEAPKIHADRSCSFPGSGPLTDTYTFTLEADAGNVDRLRLEALLSEPETASRGPGRTPHGNFVLNQIEILAQPLDSRTAWQPVKLVRASADVEQPGFPVAAAIDGKAETGWAVHRPGVPLNTGKQAVFFFDQPIAHKGGARFQVRLVQQHGGHHTLSRVRLSLGSPVATADADAVAQEDKRRAALDHAFARWLDDMEKHTVPWTPLRPHTLDSNLPYLSREPDNIIFVSGDITKDDRYTLTFKNPPLGLAALRLEALPDPRLPGHGPGMTYYEGSQGDFFLHTFSAKADGRELKLASASAAYGDDARLAIDADAITGWSGNGRSGEPNQAVFELAEPLPAEPVAELTVELRMGRHFAASLGKFRLSATTTPGAARARVLPDGCETTLARPRQEWSADEHRLMLEHFLLTAPELAEASKPVRELRKRVRPLHTLVMSERNRENPRPTWLYHRGEFLQPARQVEPGVPAFLPSMPAGTSRTRLEFARWLVSREHPLTARVTVNRHWQAFFGMGLVKTLDDFGYQGETPSHPELLDWLAVDFMDNGWSVKQLHRLIVTSATYQQSSRVSPALLKLDPQNRLLARGPRQRVDGEMVRDITLHASGLLSGKLFGPPVRPPQPASVTEGAYGGRDWPVSQGEDRYRRALYTFAKRTAPYATFQTFDAPTGEACIARREVSNTPLQSLALLNDEVFVETAQVLGRATDAQPGGLREKITFAFRRCLTRLPSEAEIEKLSAFYQRQLHRLQQGQLETAALMTEAATAEQAAWMTVARVLLNLDETITKN